MSSLPMFIAHGSPMIAIEQSEYGTFLDSLSDSIPKPDAIVIFSAHWVARPQMVAEVVSYDTIYDFGGFPDELYQIKYPAKGDARLSKRVQQLLEEVGISYQPDSQRGLDHGAWTILRRIYPNADIPIISLSVNPSLSPQEQFSIGEALSPMKQDNVLIIGSGVVVHNFQLLPVRERRDIQQAVREFESWVGQKLQAGDMEALFNYRTKGPHADLAVPIRASEHFAPLFYAVGAAGRNATAQQLHLSWDFGVLSNSAYRFDA